MRQLRVGLAQLNVSVGDVEGNARRVLDAIERARALGVDLVAFPELCLTGYPPEDLLFRPAFIEANLRALDRVARASTGLIVVVGFVDRRDDIMNAAAVCHDGAVAGVYHKQYLPNYGVFDENRYFQAGVGHAGLRAGRGRARPGGEHLRGHLVPHRPDDSADARRGGGGGLDQLLALPRRQGALPREDAGDPGGGSRRVSRVREPGRGTGRAGLRRPVHDLRPGRGPARARPGVRGGPGGRRPRPRRGVPGEAPGLAPAEGEARRHRARPPDRPLAAAGAAAAGAAGPHDGVPRSGRRGVRGARDRDP